MRHSSLNEFLELSKTGSRIAVFREIVADRLTPIRVVESLTTELKDGAVLESGSHHHDAGRYSYITFGSYAKLSTKNYITTETIGDKTTIHNTPPLELLRKLKNKLLCVGHPSIIKFIGCIGFLTYDAVRFFENIPDRHPHDNYLPEMQFNFYDTILLFDHLQHKLLIITIISIEKLPPEQAYEKAHEKINHLIKKIIAPSVAIEATLSFQLPPRHETLTDLSDAQFVQLVKQAKLHIRAGDAFQIVLSRSFTQSYTAAPLDIYRALRQVSPAPYMFYLPIGDEVIIGASPEKLISVQDRQVTINPIAGTLKKTPELDEQQITNSLLTNEKEKSEHMMLVDLARNDLGAICKPGSIEIKELLKVKHYSHVSHINSTISGELQEGKDALHALAATFPAGTLSGAPKIRAMQIIDNLESSRRNLYGGTICRLDFQGNLDSCIAIRMAHLKKGVAIVRAGAGIVHDSDPLAEANETRQKVAAMFEAIALAEDGLK